MQGSVATTPSISRSLLSRLLPAMLVLFVAGAALSYGLATHYANLVYDAWLYDSANSLAIQVRAGDSGLSVDFPEAAKRVFVWDVADVTSFEIRGSRSGVIAGRADLPVAPPGAGHYRNARVFDVTIDGRSARVASLELPARVFGETVTVSVGETRSKRNALASQMLIGMLLPQVLLIAVALWAIRLGVRSGLRPLVSVAARIEAQSHRNITTVSADDIPIELQPVTQAVDDLLGRLDRALNAQRRFIANAAHQLRTPFTALKLNVEQAQQESTIDGVRPLLEQLRLSTERATHLTEQLLTLARAEPDAVEAGEFKDFDLKELVFVVGADWVPMALRRNIEMSFSTEQESVWVNGNPTLVQEALKNLLDNAIRYQTASVGGKVDITVFAKPAPGFTILDNGPGIPAQEMSGAFQRFRRGDRGSIAGTGTGTGLGLAIVQEIATSHRGRATLEAGPDGRGLMVRFELEAKPINPRLLDRDL